MMKWLTYDLESTFLRRGFKRPDTLIIEIALYGKSVPDKKRLAAFQRLVNPLKSYDTGADVIESLHAAGQSPERTLDFWVKLLIEKKFINSAARRLDHHGKANEIAKVLNDKKDVFVHPKDALTAAIEFGKGHHWVAHNGRSFDEKIIRGACTRETVTIEDVIFSDSLPIFRKHLTDQPSYSQPILYKCMFVGQKYHAHHAEDDARALHRMLSTILCEENAKDILKDGYTGTKTSRRRVAKKTNSDLEDIKYVGPKSVAAFAKHGITSKKDLYEYILSHTIEEWTNTFVKVYRHRSLGERLYNGEVELSTKTAIV